MDAKEVGRAFLSKVGEYLLSLPYDAKLLQEAASDPDLDRGVREHAASVLLHVLSHHEGTGPERFLEDVFLVRITLQEVGSAPASGDSAAIFRGRFPDMYGPLGEDITLFQRVLGAELWQRLQARTRSFGKLCWKGKRAAQYVDDDAALEALYEDGQEFQTNFTVSEAQVQNRLRRPEQVVEHLQRKR